MRQRLVYIRLDDISRHFPVVIAVDKVADGLCVALEGGQMEGMPAVVIGQIGIGTVEHQLPTPRNVATYGCGKQAFSRAHKGLK